jgi:membrane-associated phospholipid phosphatase
MRKLTLKDFRPLDALIISYCLFMLILIGVFGGKLVQQQHILLVYLGSIFYALFWVYLRQYSKSRVLDFIIILYPMVMLTWFYEICGPQLHIFFSGFFDGTLLKIENAIFPIHPTIWFQRWNNPLVTEWMMFGYTFYLFLMPITVATLYLRGKKEESNHLALSLFTTFFICYMGFILFPVEGPRFVLKDQYTIVFQGYFFKMFANWIENNGMLHGGCFPSAHCAAATVMLLLSFKYEKKLFYVISPIIITLYISTVYGRYHYPIDVLAGIITGIIGIRLAYPIRNFWLKITNSLATNSEVYNSLQTEPLPVETENKRL